MNRISNRELAKHIFSQVKNHLSTDKNEDDDNKLINYISHLIELNSEPDQSLGSKGFVNVSEEIRQGFGC